MKQTITDENPETYAKFRGFPLRPVLYIPGLSAREIRVEPHQVNPEY